MNVFDPNVSSVEVPFPAVAMSTSTRWKQKMLDDKSWQIRWCLRGAIIAAIGLMVALSFNGYRKHAALMRLLARDGVVSTEDVWPMNQVRRNGLALPKWLPQTICSVESRDEERIGEFLDAVGRCRSLKQLYLRSRFLDDAQFQSLAELTLLDELTVEKSPKVTGTGLESLSRCQNLRFLTFETTSFSDKGVVHLKQLPNILRLSLIESQITDRGLVELARLPKIYHLELSSPHLTAKGIQALAMCSTLMELEFGSIDPAAENPDPITPEAVERLQKTMPWCVVSDGNVY